MLGYVCDVYRLSRTAFSSFRESSQVQKNKLRGRFRILHYDRKRRIFGKR